jgi:DNA-binding transcriptional ArsR family regulator/RimJ/RimL family protein N-acetyltransferase
MQPQFQDYPESRAELLGAAGFAFRRETDRFEWQGREPLAMPDRLVFRTLEEVGEEEFVDAIRRVSEGTLDREIRDERERLGPQGAAREFFEDARRVKHEPAWWRLAYKRPEGDPVGLVMPAEPPAFLTVFYVGVVPEMRGQGYVDDLLAAGATTLLEARRRDGSEKPLRADTDVANASMAAAFERAGWARFARRREYAVGLAPTPEGDIFRNPQNREEDAQMADRGAGIVYIDEVPEDVWQEGRFGGREQDLGRAAGEVSAVVQEEFGITQPAVSQHLRVLRDNGFARVRAEGTRRLYAVDPAPLQEVDMWLEGFRRFWTQRLDALGTELARGKRERRRKDDASNSSSGGTSDRKEKEGS